MWPRLAEFLLGLWLALTPVIFAETVAIESFATRDVIAGITIMVLSALSFWQPAGWAHYVTGLVAIALGMAAYFGPERPGPPAAQNEIAVALTLLLFAIVPNEAARPPRPWRSHAEAPPRSI